MRGVVGLPVFFILIFVFAGGAAAREGALERARAHFDEGKYVAAADWAASAGTADGYAFAARALMTLASRTDDRGEAKDVADAAKDYAEEALDLNKDHVEAHLQTALAIGLKGRYSTAFGAYVKRYAPRGRAHIERALELHPDNAWAMALMGAWHLEVVRRGGARVYGGSVEEGRAWFEKGLAADPKNGVMSYNYAVALIALEDATLDDLAAAVLSQAAGCPAKGVLAEEAHTRAVELAELLALDPEAAHAKVAARF